MTTETVTKVSKVSEIKVDDLKNYLRITDLTEDDKIYLKTILTVAKDFIKNNTGIDDDIMDKYSDFIIVVYVLCQDMYDTRAYYVDNTNVNKIVTTILGMHDRNLL